MDRVGRSLEAACLLALLLSLGLPQVPAGNWTGRQVGLMCHVCEAENDFGCKNEVTCPKSEQYCNLVATKAYPRVYYVSKQCSSHCPYVWQNQDQPKSFLLEKPPPFFYVNCCRSSLCNINGPNIKDDEFRELAGRASVSSHSQAIMTVLVASATTFTGLSLL